MNAETLRGMPVEELETKITDWSEQLFRYRCEKKVGQLENTNMIPATKKLIARGKTILNEKSNEPSGE